MVEQLVLNCDDSIEGIFTAIYDGFCYKKTMQENYFDNVIIRIGEGANYTLFSQEILVETDIDKARKTIDFISNKLGYSLYWQVLLAACHFHEDRGTILMGFLVRAFKVGPRITEYMTDPYVMQVFEMARKVGNERDKILGFLRFKDVGKFLFSEIEPKCNMIPVIYEHFVDRYPNEHFVIYDNKRRCAFVHQAFATGRIIMDVDLHGYNFEVTDAFEILWKQYFKTMGIEERENYECQRNLAPIWYRKNMLEYD